MEVSTGKKVSIASEITFFKTCLEFFFFKLDSGFKLYKVFNKKVIIVKAPRTFSGMSIHSFYQRHSMHLAETNYGAFSRPIYFSVTMEKNKIFPSSCECFHEQ